MTHLPRRPGRLNRSGFTLVELVIIIVTLGILAAVAIPRFADVAEGSRVTATRDELNKLKRAIVGDPSTTAGGEYVDRGFEGDIGHPPSALIDLIRKPDSIGTYDRLTRIGWNGPYIDSAENKYLTDAWGNPYSYDPSVRRIASGGAGDGDSIVVTF
ncbi:prepilin-type N-terminal cleavage/methylation domain-containing protein [bacterium]|nr:prepilin-type N-terminal cleavage/methylation domain-containing protein [bacterium]MCB2201666.1 prepilin-type N-terminal cleavage/methylation domain-containing protein [bacterium]